MVLRHTNEPLVRLWAMVGSEQKSKKRLDPPKRQGFPSMGHVSWEGKLICCDSTYGTSQWEREGL